MAIQCLHFLKILESFIHSLIFFETEDANKFLPKLSPLTGIIISLSLTLYGYVYLISRTSFTSQSANLIDLGRSMGFSNFKIF